MRRRRQPRRSIATGGTRRRPRGWPASSRRSGADARSPGRTRICCWTSCVVVRRGRTASRAFCHRTSSYGTRPVRSALASPTTSGSSSCLTAPAILRSLFSSRSPPARRRCRSAPSRRSRARHTIISCSTRARSDRVIPSGAAQRRSRGIALLPVEGPVSPRTTTMTAALAAFLLPACGGGSRAPTPPPAPATAPRVIGYLAGWGVQTKGTRIADLPGAELTHIIYAFARIADDGRLTLSDACLDAGQCDSATTPATHRAGGGNFAELRRLKERHPQLKLLMAVGGWTGSGRFSDVALTAESRAAFAKSAVDLVIRRWPGLFDGIDIDWE